jgi:hypothetical protein
MPSYIQDFTLWGDVVSTAEELRSEKEWRETGEAGAMLARIHEIMMNNMKAPVAKSSNKRSIRWATEEDVAPVIKKTPYDELLPHEADIISREAFDCATVGAFSQKLIREFPECAAYVTVEASEYSCLKPWQTPQVYAAFSKWFGGVDVKRIVDVTAHIGADTIHMASMFPTATIDAYEIHLDAFVALQRNIVGFGKSGTVRAHWRDCMTWTPLQSETIDIVYADPPWGGVTYDRVQELDLYFQPEDSTPCKEKNLNVVIDKWFATKRVKNIVVKVAPNFAKKVLQSKYQIQEAPIYNRAGRVAYYLLYIPSERKEGMEAVIPIPAIKPNCPRLDNSQAWVRRGPSAQPATSQALNQVVQSNPWNRHLQAHSFEEEKKQAPPTPIKNTIKTLIIRNLPRNMGDGELRAIYSRYGNITDIYIPMNKDRTSPYFGTIKGFALVKYAQADDALKGYIAEGTMIKREIHGKKLITEFAKEDR